MRTLIFLAIWTLNAGAVTLYELTFDQAALQNKVAAKFPYSKEIYTKKTRMRVGVLLLTNPQVLLSKESSRISLYVDFEFFPTRFLGLQAKPISGSTVSSARIRYDVDSASFFLDEAEMDELDIDRLVRIGDKILAEYINRKLPVWLAEKGPIYTLAGDYKRAIGRSMLQDVRVRQGDLVLKLGVGEASNEPDLDGASGPQQPSVQVEPGIEFFLLAP